MRVLIFRFLLAVLVPSLVAQENLKIEFSTHKIYVQTSLTELKFIDGSLDVGVEDGSFKVLGCVTNGTGFAASPRSRCSAGTTGWISEVSRYSDRFTKGQFWSMEEPTAFSIISPEKKDMISMQPAPGSSLPVSAVSGSHWDYSPLIIKYNVLNPEHEDYVISYYRLKRPYFAGATEGLRFQSEIPAGPYTLDLPTLPDNPESSLSIQHEHLPLPESGAHPDEEIPVQFRFTNEQWLDGCLSFTSVDPDDSLLFEWEGVGGETMSEGDILEFTIRESSTGWFLLPERIVTLDATTTQFSVPASVIASGVSPFVELVYKRVGNSSEVTELSTRTLRAYIFTSQSYLGYAQAEASKRGLTAEDVLPEVDFDADGYTNFFEYALSSSPFIKSSIPIITSGYSRSSGEFWFETKVRPHIEDQVDFQFQGSSNLRDFERITEESIGWNFNKEQPDRIRIHTNLENDLDKVFVRLKVLQISEAIE